MFIHGTKSSLLNLPEFTHEELIDNPLNELINQIEYGKYHGYFNINVILTYTILCQELSYDITTIITDDVINDIKRTINAFSILLYFDSVLKPCNNTIGSNVTDAIYTYFTLDYIRSKMPTDKRLIDGISYEFLQDVLVLPNPCLIQCTYSYSDDIVQLDITHPFVSNDDYQSMNNYNAYSVDYLLYRLIQNLSLYSINDLLEKYANNMCTSEFWIEFKDKLRFFIKEFYCQLDQLI